MDKTIPMILILLIISMMISTRYALGADTGENISANEITSGQHVIENDTLVFNDTANVVNVTENSNETNIAEKMIQDQRKSSAGYPFIYPAIIISVSIMLTILIICYKKSGKRRQT